MRPGSKRLVRLATQLTRSGKIIFLPELCHTANQFVDCENIDPPAKLFRRDLSKALNHNGLVGRDETIVPAIKDINLPLFLWNKNSLLGSVHPNSL